VYRILESPLVYRLWQAPFAVRKFEPVARYLQAHPPTRVLDAGCGPGTNAGRFSHVDYVGVDVNARYLEVARAMHQGRFIEADLATANLSALGQFDTIIVNSFLHHLPDPAVQGLLDRLHDLLEPDGRIHVLELVLPANLSISRVMARIDRGRFARPLEHWRALLGARFTPVVVEPYMLGRWLWSMLYFQGARS
jgi:SAM-dependent methyltransferase